MLSESVNICEIKDRKTWDSFVISQPKHTFLHSWAWGEFNEAMGDKVWRLGIFYGEELVSVALVIKIHARRGNFLFVPHGPIFQNCHARPVSRYGVNSSGHPDLDSCLRRNDNASKILVGKFKEFAKQEKASFIRVSPLLENTEENKAMFKNLGFRTAPIHMHAETTWTLNLESSEDVLLMGMRKTTRNLIRRAIKEGVEIKMGTGERDVEIFNNLYKETVSRHIFTPFSWTYLKNQVKILGSPPYQGGVRGDSLVFTAYYNNEPLASAIVVFYGNSAFYHHGASSPTKYPKIPAAYLLQWEAMREAKRRGHKFYNFWGVIPSRNVNGQWSMVNGDKKHPWSGITLFKTGFGGFESNYLHAQDLILSWKYWPSWVIETLRKKRRNL